MNRQRLAAGVAALLLALTGAVAFADYGDYLSSSDFSLSSYYSYIDIQWDDEDNRFRITLGGSYKRYIRSYSASGSYLGFDQTVHMSNGVSPTAVEKVGDRFWVLDDTRDRIYAYELDGDRAPSEQINLADGIDNLNDLVYCRSYLRILDYVDDKVYAYTTGGTRSTSQEFALANGNGNPVAIGCAGTHYLVADSADDKVYVYDSDRQHDPALDFALTSGNDNPVGIAFDGEIRVLDSADKKIYTYDFPTDTYGLYDDTDYVAGIGATTTESGAWKCFGSSAGETVTVNNAELTVHGFCAQESGGSGMEIEIHLAATSTYLALDQFASVTGIWYVVEQGYQAAFDRRIYSDTLNSSDQLSFTEEAGDLEASTRLGFATMAKSVTDTNCAESSGGGFQCSRDYLGDLSTSDAAVLLFALADANTLDNAGTPATPDSVTVARTEDYDTATVSWDLVGPVAEYQIERLTAVTVSVGESSRIEYGDPVVFTVAGTEEGVDEYTDDTIEVHRTYQYRIRARGAGATAWSSWSDYVFSGAAPELDLPAPANVQLSRDAATVTASWTAPPGVLDGYTLQRQEFVSVGGSTFFANIVTLSPVGSDWLGATTTDYTDDTIIGTQTYEYRVAAVKDDLVGIYSDWFRVAPADTSLGAAPTNFRYTPTGSTIYDERREFWLEWDAVAGVDDYEVRLEVFDISTGGRTQYTYVVTDPTYFYTTYGRVHVRVRGRKLDTVRCAAAADDRCRSDWTGWYQVRFAPKVTITAPATTTPSASTEEFREAAIEATEAILEVFGTTPDGAQVLHFGVLTFGLVLGALSVAMTWRRGMAPLGAGMGASVLILVWYTGYRLLGTPLPWPLAAQVAITTVGMYALTRQFGVFR